MATYSLFDSKNVFVGNFKSLSDVSEHILKYGDWDWAVREQKED
jgi:hypothetical protein